MDKNNIGRLVIANTILYIVKYISSFFLAFLICDIIVMILMIVVHSGFEKLFTWLLIYTPFQKNFGLRNVSFGTNDMISIFSFWSFVVLVIRTLISKIYKPKYTVNTILFFFLFLTVLHIFALIRQTNAIELFPVVMFFYVSSLLVWVIYKLINKLTFVLDSFFNNNNNKTNPSI